MKHYAPSHMQGFVDRKQVKAPSVIILLAVPRRLFCFGSLVILSLFLLYINIKIGTNRCLMLD